MGRKSKLDTTITPCFKETVSDGLKIVVELDERISDTGTDCIVRKYLVSKVPGVNPGPPMFPTPPGVAFHPHRQLLQVGEGKDWTEAFANLHHVLST